MQYGFLASSHRFRLCPACFLVLVFSCILLAPPAIAHDGDATEGPDGVSISPDLLDKIGRTKAAILSAEAMPASMYEEMNAARVKAGSPKITGTGTCLVILWDFTDHAADQVAHPSSAYDDLLFSTGTNPTGSMNDYYLENSYGVFGVSGSVIGWTTAQNTYASYAVEGEQNASTCRVMIEDAIAQLDATVDFSLYDNDGPDGVPNSGDDDGYVDALFFIHAGPGEESSGDVWDIWSHAWGFYSGLATNDGVSIFRYSVEPEEMVSEDLMTMGVFAHEYGHVLGLPDLYDTDYSTSGIGEWGLMSGGSWGRRPGDLAGSSPSHLTGWAKMKLGWVTPITVTADMYDVLIPPVETNSVVYRIFRDGATTGDEYFLLENRRRLGFDESLVRRQIVHGLAAPEGLLITHVDDSVSSNAGETHRLVDVVEATPWISDTSDWWEQLDGVIDYSDYLHLNMFNRADNGDLWPGFSDVTADSTDWVAPRTRDCFADLTIPPAEDYYCDPTGIGVMDITLVGQDVQADLLIDVEVTGLPGKAAKAEITWDFESDDNGWQFCNSYVHWDDTQAAGCPGDGGLYFGVDDPTFVCGPGYGNGWSDFSWTTAYVSTTGPVSIGLTHKYDTETGYDGGHLEVRKAGDASATWHELWYVDGVSACTTDNVTVGASILSECEIMTGVAALDIRLRLTSDSGWSAQDGSYCGFGWFVDAVSISGTISGVDDEIPGVLSAMLMAPTPNPFNPSTVLRLHIPADAQRAELTVFDQRGRLVRHLDVNAAVAGWVDVRWNGEDDGGQRQPSGVYFARLDVDGVQRVVKMAMVK